MLFRLCFSRDLLLFCTQEAPLDGQPGVMPHNLALQLWQHLIHSTLLDKRTTPVPTTLCLAMHLIECSSLGSKNAPTALLPLNE